MERELEAFVEEITGDILEENRRAYGDEAFRRWKTRIMMGRIPDPDGHAAVRGGCGDTMEIYLKFETGKAVRASFVTDGCGSSVACGSVAAELALGRTPDRILEITPEAIRDETGGLPPDDSHCADLAAAALQEALNQYMLHVVGKKQ